MSKDSPVFPHGQLEHIFDDIYMVTGSNITEYEGLKIQHSRNMTIIHENGELTIINSVRLKDEELKQLDNIGQVKNIIRIGAFHGRDDAFYLERYKSKFWAFADTQLPDNHQLDHCLTNDSKLPIQNSQFISFANTSPKEGVIYLSRHGGILITCDSVKNWMKVDEFFSDETATIAQKTGEIACARISPIWINATGASKQDFDPVMKQSFKHLISAHGDVLKNIAYEKLTESLARLSRNAV